MCVLLNERNDMTVIPPGYKALRDDHPDTPSWSRKIQAKFHKEYLWWCASYKLACSYKFINTFTSSTPLVSKHIFALYIVARSINLTTKGRIGQHYIKLTKHVLY